MQTIIYLVRHGSYENPKGILHGRLPGFPLSKEGKFQVHNLATFLKNKAITAVYSSPLTRAYETAAIIAAPHKVKVQTDKRLLDIKTPLQGKPLSYLHSINFRLYRHEFIKAGGEKLSDVFKRMDLFLKDILKQYPGKTIVVVSHGDPIQSIAFKYRGVPLYSRMPFEKNYVGVAHGYKLIFNNLRFKSLTKI